MVDLDGYRRIPGLQNFCKYLLHAGINDQNNKIWAFWVSPISGGQHSPITLKPNECAKILVAKNTAIRIMNQSNTEASVQTQSSWRYRSINGL
jgi:hypothetical protein